MGNLLIVSDTEAVDDLVEALIETVIERLEMPDGSFDDYLIDETLRELAEIWVTVEGWEPGNELAVEDLIKSVVALEEQTNFTYSTDTVH